MPINFLITRPIASATALAEKIKNSHNSIIYPIIFPVIETISINQNIAFPSPLDIAIFTSPAAVEHTAAHISAWPQPITLCAVGESTAQKIQHQGWGQALFPHRQFSSEALLALPELQNIKNKHIVICTGAGGNPLLCQTLSARGAHVRKIIVYQRCLPRITALPDLKPVDIILCTSSESMNNLITLYGNAIKEKRLLVSSERLSALAAESGFKLAPLMADNAGDTAVINAIINFMEQERI